MTQTKKATPNRWATVYKGILTMKDKPVPLIYIEKLAEELLDWAENTSDANTIIGFTSKRKITRTLFLYLCDNHPILKEAYLITLEILGARRESKGLAGEWKEGMITKVQHIYNPEWLNATHFKLANDSKTSLDTSNANFLNQIILGNGEVIDVGDGGK